VACILTAGWGLWHLWPAGGLAAGPPPLPTPAMSAPAPAPAASQTAPLSLDRQAPSRLLIKKINMGVLLDQIGLRPNGMLETPPYDKVDRAFWYRNGAAPGQAGPAVIVAHVDTKERLGAFFYLSKVRPGYEIEVVRPDKSVVVFTTTSVEEFPKANFPTMRVYGPTAAPTLRLITCGGKFDRSTGHYLDNIVVFATMTGFRPPPSAQ
jgi:hypothetical protein